MPRVIVLSGATLHPERLADERREPINPRPLGE